MGVLGVLGGFEAKVRVPPGVLGVFHEISEKSIINVLWPFFGVICWVKLAIFFGGFSRKNGRKNGMIFALWRGKGGRYGVPMGMNAFQF